MDGFVQGRSEVGRVRVYAEELLHRYGARALVGNSRDMTKVALVAQSCHGLFKFFAAYNTKRATGETLPRQTEAFTDVSLPGRRAGKHREYYLEILLPDALLSRTGFGEGSQKGREGAPFMLKRIHRSQVHDSPHFPAWVAASLNKRATPTF